MHNIRNYTTPIIAATTTTTTNDMNNKHSAPKLNGFSDSHSIGNKQLNGISLISHLTSSFLAASAASNGHNHHHSSQYHSTCSSTSSSSTNGNTVCNAKSTYRSGQRNSLTRNSSVNDDQLTSSRNSTSSSSFLSLASCPSSANKHSLASTTHRNSIVNYAENDSVFEESSLLSSSNQRMDDLKQNFEEEDDDNDAVAVLVTEDVIDDVDIDEDIIIKKSNININNNQDDYLDDFNASIDNLSKLKLKQENIDFLNLVKKCQNWIETTTAKKFQFPNDFRKSLENGVLLCELLNVLKKNCVRRINRYPTPIAGIDNLNVFLKACQQNFQLAQSNLFDTIDLEDLNKRRGNNNSNSSQNNCNSNIIKKDLNDSTDETTSHWNNQSKEIDSTNSTNENILDEEQQRRLKKVVNTIYWLSRKAIELGIPLAYEFETNNHSHTNTSNTIKNNSLKQNAKVSSSNTSSFYYSSNLSLNQYSSSTSSSLSSSSSFIASISSSASSSASTSSSSHHSNNQYHHHTNNLLSVIVSTPVVSTNNQQTTNTKFSTNNINAPNPQLLLKKKYNSNNKKIIKPADELETSTNGPDNMSYIYKQQPQLVTNKNTNNNNSNTNNQRSASIQIDATDSFLLGKNLEPSKNSSKHPNSNNDLSNFTSSPSSSSPGSIAGGANHHMQASTLPNSSGHSSSNNYLTDSQDDLQLIDSTMSPISSSTNSAISPHLLSTSSSANLSNSNSNLAGINAALGSAGNQQQQTTNNKTMVIPTRFVDRRVSTGVNQTYKFNYSEAGKKMARQAQEQLKTVEKCKEKNEDAAPTLDPVRSKRAENSNGSGSGSGGGSINDDWQNTVDDWKKRRREKVKMPPSRNGQNGEILDDEDQQQQYTKSERKRINRFENSHYYIQPLSENDDNPSNDLNNEINAIANLECNQPVNNGQEFVANEKKNSKTQNANKTSAATIEISGVRNHSVDKENQLSPKSNLLLKNQQKSNQLNDSIQPSDDISMNENDTSVCNIYYSYVFVEKTVDLTRTDDYNLRGFGFLLKNGSGNNHLIHSTLSERTNFILSQNYAEIVGLDPHSLADKAGLKKGDLVVKINECPTSNLSSEQLRKIMTDRLKLNSIQMTVLSLEKPDLNKIEEEKEELVEKKIINEKIEEKFISKSNLLLSNVNGSKPPHQDYNLLAPKPYRKSLPSSVSTSTLTSSSNQLLLLSNLTEMNVTTANSTLNINNNTASSLIDKQKSQLTLILNWTTQEQVSSQFTPSLISPDLSAFGSYDSSSSMCSLLAAGLKTSSKPISLSPSSSIELTDDGNNSSIYDSLNEIICKNNKNLLHSIPYNQTTSGDLELHKEETKIKTNVNYDDTDHDNDDVDSDELLLPPPIPATEPPPLPSSGSVNLLNKTNNVSKEIVAPTDLIKKELKDKMKCVENWKIEQEILMKRKYQEEQKKIEISLKVDLEKVKEEENQRREQERLKLEKERLRLQELELKEREHELKTNSLLKTAENETDSLSQQTQPTKSISKMNETVRKEDLTALIEKIYTEQENEADFLIEYTQPPTAKSSAVQEPKPANKPLPSPSPSSSSSSSFSLKSSTIVMTKTSPIVAAALSCEEEDLYLMELNNKMARKHEREIFTDLIDTTNKHQIIKQVHDSMDNLKNQLLHKGMNKYADDVDNMNKNLDATRKKQEELERIKCEQEQIKMEKERIEQEKEKLRQEAEQLRIERELILMAATSKAAVISAVTPLSSSSSSSSTTMNEQIEPDFGIANNQTDYNNSYKTPNYLSDHQVNSLGASLSSSSLSPPRKYYPDNGPISHKSGLMMSQPQSWLIEEVERKRMLNSNQIINPMIQSYTDQQQRLRRSYPNLLIDSNSFDPRSTNINYMNSQSSFINTPLSSTTGFTKIYSKKKPSSSSSQQQSVSRPIKLQQHRINSSQQSVINSANCLYTNAKPPQPSHRLISNSSNDLKSVVKIQQNKHQLMVQQSQNQFSKNTSLSNNTQPSATIISLNQQCSSCSHALGQGSAMFIEKLGLAFHLKCFRCSVCSIPLGNGKEGTDVRVSVTNRLHCNNCFSNDLGVRLSAV